MNERRISSIDELAVYAESVLDEVASMPHEGAVVLALHGDLGTGKTAFVKALAKHMGITEHVTSPTFVIMKRYETQQPRNDGFKTLVHVDAYRLETARELEVLGWKELCADPDVLIALEWPEKVPGIVPNTAHYFMFGHVDETTRTISRTN